MTRRPKRQKTRVSKRSKWQEEPSDKKTQMTRRLKLQKDPCDKKTQMTRRFEWKKDPNYWKTKVTRRHMWHEEWKADRQTDRVLTGGQSLICWMTLLKNTFSLINWEDNNIGTTSLNMPKQWIKKFTVN